MKLLLPIIVLLILSSPVIAEIEHLHSLNKTEQFTLTSKVNNHRYHIYVKRPEKLAENTLYPTVYLLDGGITFPLFASYSHYLEFAEDIPEVIIVGISYGTGDWKNGNHRSTDFTAPSDEREFWGGAEKFSAMLRDELFPLIQSKTPSDPDKRIVFGQSLGGQYVIYSMMFQPDLFFGHISSNPALHRNVEFFMQQPLKTETQQNIFIARAENDAAVFADAFDVWLSYWKKEQYPWKMKERWFAGHNHFSIAPNAFRQGMKYFLP